MGAWEWALAIRLGKTGTWALTREWALARDTTVVQVLTFLFIYNLGIRPSYLKLDIGADHLPHPIGVVTSEHVTGESHGENYSQDVSE